MSGTKEHMPFPGHRTCAEWEPEDHRRENSGRPRDDQLAWCPPEYRDAYRDLRRKGWVASAARPMIEEQIATDARRGSTYVPLGCDDSRKAYAAR